jgi:AraC-like DNA-binding protein/uncharacterized RmlC-like cupin family protein
MQNPDYRLKDGAAGLSVIRKSRASTNPERHFHDSWEVLYIISGERTFFYGSRTLQIKGGDFLCIRPGVLHRGINRKGESCDLVNLYFEDTSSPWFESLLPLLVKCGTDDNPVISLREVDRYRTAKILADIARELEEKQPGYVELSRSLVVQCLVDIMRYVPQSAANTGTTAMNPRIVAVIDWLAAHYRDEVTLKQTAALFGMSESYLSRSFRQNTHFSFIEYLNSLRVQESCRLLTSSNLPVQVVAETCGFGSNTQFGRFFRKITGFSPLSYRKHSLKHM